MTFDESKKSFSLVPSLRRTFAKVLHDFPHDGTILLYGMNGAGIYATVTAYALSQVKFLPLKTDGGSRTAPLAQPTVYALFRVALALEKGRQGVI